MRGALLRGGFQSADPATRFAAVQRPADRLAFLDRPLAVRAVLMIATLFNAGLAIVNANGAALNSSIVIACEALVTAAALVLGIDGRHPYKTRWIILGALLFGLGVANGLGSGGIDPKLMRDVLLIPVFVLLGLASQRDDLIRVVLWLQIIVVGVMVFEAIRPEEFGRVFNVMAYYLNTRGFQKESFWNADSDLFVSATRPGERFLFSALNIHRLSSVFLEPVSLGNYCVVVGMVVALTWSRLSVGQRVFFCVTEFTILVGCDGRFATVCILLLVILRLIAPTLPRFSNWLYLPAILGVATLGVVVLHLSPQGDDFSSRTAGSVWALGRISPEGLLGFAGPAAYSVMDSGIAYLVYSQSLAGTVLLWSFVALGITPRDRVASAMLHMVSLYFVLNLLISYSVFSIKTAALLWFAYGHIARHSGAYLRFPRTRMPRAEAGETLSAAHPTRSEFPA